MNKRRLVRFLPLLVFFISVPWVTENTQTFERRAFLVLALVGALYMGIQLWVRWLERRPRYAETSTAAPQGIKLGSTTVSYWCILGLACGLALFMDTTSVTLVTSDTMKPFQSFLLCTLCQQSIFAGAAFLVAQRAGTTLKPVSRATTLLALMAMSVMFARVSNIAYEAHRPSLQPRFSDSTNMLFALPALLVGAAGILHIGRKALSS